MPYPEIDELIKRYAEVIVEVGLQITPGRRLLLRSPIAAAPLARAVTRAAYQAGAPYVDLIWSDEQTQLIRLQHAPRDSFEEYPQWYVDSALQAIDRGDAFLALVSDTPGLLADQDQAAVATIVRTTGRRSEPISVHIQRNSVPWAVAAAANPAWARRLFPNDAPEAAELNLWRAIFAACRIDQADPVSAWRTHIANLANRAEYMTQRHYQALRFRGPGTDLTVGLPKGHCWAGGGSISSDGTPFVPNLPTEEIFTLPECRRVEGVVRASRPLNLNGMLVEDFELTFEGGSVVQLRAANGEEALRRTIAVDEGAARLGEVALVAASSPIGASGLLFANTLYDENAACHLALGRAYRFTLEGGAEMDAATFAAAGGNESAIHIDFMIGSSAMDIDGITGEGAVEPVFRSGEWAV
ncbi:MAG: aminopeptidase [Oscillochloris sp.]|nr:aminopeptidase [Oscillochloris sp.]